MSIVLIMMLNLTLSLFPPLDKMLYENVFRFTGLKRAWARRCHKTIEISQ